MGTVIPPVRPWPAAQQAALDDLVKHGLAVISITPDVSAAREQVRLQIRAALLDTLAAAGHCPPSQVQLFSEAAQALRVVVPGRKFGVSITHEAGLSLAAIIDGGAVGVDLVHVDELLDWKPVAQLYLGDEATAAISRHPAAEQARCFALKWTEHEARLKCCGLGISEWSVELAGKLAGCSVSTLDVPAVYAGSIAVLMPPISR
ncbi:4'-phosphopantetheinyl transferase family protein [Undibacterium sp.]|uniref:4'-phosphopantetheinyl transferase family protein n=1 Tax=Undibacterium sp. TaxID=1914977 RepID=UPI00374DD841